jgi:hypothetical protein
VRSSKSPKDIAAERKSQTAGMVGWYRNRPPKHPTELPAGFPNQHSLNIMEKWDVRDGDARTLLGGVSHGQFYEIKKNPHRTLDADTLTRISYLVGIFKALNILYSKKPQNLPG